MNQNFWGKAHRTLRIMLIVCVPLWLFVLLVAVIHWSADLQAGSLADWVGSIGSIFALIGAAYFPIWHMQRAERRKAEVLRASIGDLARDVIDKLWLLSNCFASPIKEKEWMSQYLQNHRDTDFDTVLDQLDQFSISDLPSGGARAIGAIRDAVVYAKRTVALLPQWIESGFSHPEVVRALRSKRDYASLVCHFAQVKIEADTMLHVKAGKQLEAGEVIPEPIMIRGVRVYCRYCVKQTDIQAGLPAYAVAIQLVAPFGPPQSLLLYRAQDGWTDKESLWMHINATAERIIDGWAEDPRIL
ncbi:hypothetical protein MRX33_09605 [Pseudomonas sp. JI-2]|nr:hypothetical protein [Pseudomonas sp. JI-2]